MRQLFSFLLVFTLALFSFAPATQFIIKGSVTDAKGTPIAGATIIIKSTRTGTITGTDGSFSLKVTTEKVRLVISAIGYVTKEIRAYADKSCTIVLDDSQANLEEVVVLSAAPTKKSYMVGSVQTIAGVQISSTQNYTSTTAYDQEQFSGKYNREGYDHITENPFLRTKDNALSTFSIDVDAAAYSNVRRFLNDNQLPPAGAVRIEEMVNYFKYNYPQPAGTDPFVVSTEISDCPWNKNNRLAVIGLQGKTMPVEDLPAANIVFLIDVSGSMYSAEKLPLVKQSLKLLVDQLREKDKVALCVYAGNAGLVLPSTNGTQKRKIKDAIDALEAGGSTAGGAGIQLAYKTAADNFIQGGNNRVILCTDGDFNVGTSSDDALETLIEKERNSGVFLTVLGFGTGNYQDAKMQKLADKGNGNHAYIDQLNEARKVLVNEFGGTLFTIAKDVKLQVEFNPALVQGYRLIGYENRMLAKEDFNDDKKDAGELGSGHTVTAIYEIIPAGVKTDLLKQVDTLKYQPQEKFSASNFSNELMTIKLRYKKPDGNTSKLLEQPVKDAHIAIAATSENYRFAAAVAEFGMLLRKSEYKGTASYKNVLFLANSALQFDKDGYRKEFVKLAGKALSIDKGGNKTTGDEETEDAAFAQ